MNVVLRGNNILLYTELFAPVQFCLQMADRYQVHAC